MLYKRKNSKFWWFKITPPNGGEPIRATTKLEDKIKAQEFHDRYKAQLWDHQVLGHKPRYRWMDAVVRWQNESQKKSSNDDICIFRYLDKFFANTYIDDITVDTIEKVITDKSATASPARVNRITSLIRAVLRKAERVWEWINKAPAIRRLKEDAPPIRWLSESEETRLFKELPRHIQALARFSLETGLRESNVTGLQWNQVDLENKRAWINSNQAKADKAIGIPLSDIAIEVLKSQKGKHEVFVFTFRGNPLKKAGSTAFKNALLRARVEHFRWHDLRHTWATRHVQSGTPLHSLQVLGGWSSYEMVLRYAHLGVEHLAEHVNKKEKKKIKQSGSLSLDTTLSAMPVLEYDLPLPLVSNGNFLITL